MNNSDVRIFKFKSGNAKDLDSLYEDYVWFSTLSELNDPYEGRAHFDASDIDDELRIKFLESIYSQKPKKEISPKEEALEYFLSYEKETGTPFSKYVDESATKLFREYYQLHKDSTGIFSFSKPLDNNSFPSPLNSILMWAHYSKGFRGYCIEFSYSKLRNSIEHLNETQLGSAEVKYAVDGKLPIVSIRKFMEETIGGQKGRYIQILKTFSHKEFSWQYENEARLLSNSKGKLLIDPNCINAIYLSESMPSWMKSNIRNCISEKKEAIKLYEVLLHDSEYKLGYKEST